MGDLWQLLETAFSDSFSGESAPLLFAVLVLAISSVLLAVRAVLIIRAHRLRRRISLRVQEFGGRSPANKKATGGRSVNHIARPFRLIRRFFQIVFKRSKK